MKKKLLAALLALAMAFTLLPMAVFAAEGEESTPGTGGDTDVTTPAEPAGTAEDPILLTSQSASDGQIKLNPGKYYKLNADITGVNFVGLWGTYDDGASGETTLDLNNHSITAAGEGYGAIYLATGSLKITGTGELIGYSASQPYGTIMLQGSGEKALTVDSGVTIKAEANQYCISVTGAADQKVNQATVTLNECKLDSKGSGIAVNGYITEGTEPKIILNGASITAQDHGIYLAGKAKPIENVNNANTALKAEKDGTFGNSFPQMWDVKVSGLQSDKYYLIRVAAKGISTTADGNSIIIALNNPAADAYTVTCKPGQNVTVFELEAKPTDWTGSIQTLTEYEMTVPGENG